MLLRLIALGVIGFLGLGVQESQSFSFGGFPQLFSTKTAPKTAPAPRETKEKDPSQPRVSENELAKMVAIFDQLGAVNRLRQQRDESLNTDTLLQIRMRLQQAKDAFANIIQEFTKFIREVTHDQQAAVDMAKRELNRWDPNYNASKKWYALALRIEAFGKKIQDEAGVMDTAINEAIQGQAVPQGQKTDLSQEKLLKQLQGQQDTLEEGSFKKKEEDIRFKRMVGGYATMGAKTIQGFFQKTISKVEEMQAELDKLQKELDLAIGNMGKTLEGQDLEKWKVLSDGVRSNALAIKKNKELFVTELKRISENLGGSSDQALAKLYQLAQNSGCSKIKNQGDLTDPNLRSCMLEKMTKVRGLLASEACSAVANRDRITARKFPIDPNRPLGEYVNCAKRWLGGDREVDMGYKQWDLTDKRGVSTSLQALLVLVKSAGDLLNLEAQKQRNAQAIGDIFQTGQGNKLMLEVEGLKTRLSSEITTLLEFLYAQKVQLSHQLAEKRMQRRSVEQKVTDDMDIDPLVVKLLRLLGGDAGVYQLAKEQAVDDSAKAVEKGKGWLIDGLRWLAKKTHREDLAPNKPKSTNPRNVVQDLSEDIAAIQVKLNEVGNLYKQMTANTGDSSALEHINKVKDTWRALGEKARALNALSQKIWEAESKNFQDTAFQNTTVQARVNKAISLAGCPGIRKISDLSGESLRMCLRSKVVADPSGQFREKESVAGDARSLFARFKNKGGDVRLLSFADVEGLIQDQLKRLGAIRNISDRVGQMGDLDIQVKKDLINNLAFSNVTTQQLRDDLSSARQKVDFFKNVWIQGRQKTLDKLRAKVGNLKGARERFEFELDIVGKEIDALSSLVTNMDSSINLAESNLPAFLKGEAGGYQSAGDLLSAYLVYVAIAIPNIPNMKDQMTPKRDEHLLNWYDRNKNWMLPVDKEPLLQWSILTLDNQLATLEKGVDDLQNMVSNPEDSSKYRRDMNLIASQWLNRVKEVGAKLDDFEDKLSQFNAQADALMGRSQDIPIAAMIRDLQCPSYRSIGDKLTGLSSCQQDSLATIWAAAQMGGPKLAACRVSANSGPADFEGCKQALESVTRGYMEEDLAGRRQRGKTLEQGMISESPPLSSWQRGGISDQLRGGNIRPEPMIGQQRQALVPAPVDVPQATPPEDIADGLGVPAPVPAPAVPSEVAEPQQAVPAPQQMDTPAYGPPVEPFPNPWASGDLGASRQPPVVQSENDENAGPMKQPSQGAWEGRKRPQGMRFPSGKAPDLKGSSLGRIIGPA